MPRNRKRLTKRSEPKAKGIPVAKLGAEFEWIDSRLKIGLEAYPTLKRPICNSRMDIAIALQMYYDQVSGKWQPLEAIDIAAVNNYARYYASVPPELTVDQFAAMKIDSNQRLVVNDEVRDNIQKGIIFEKVYEPSDVLIDTIEISDYQALYCRTLIDNVVGTGNNINFDYYTPNDETIEIYDLTPFSTGTLRTDILHPFDRFRVFVQCNPSSSFDLHMYFGLLEHYVL